MGLGGGALLGAALVCVMVGGAAAVTVGLRGKGPTLWKVPVDLDGPLERLKAAGVTLPMTKPSLRVHKAQRRLELLEGDRVVKSYKMALGSDPLGTKLVEGDGKTPEGSYRVCNRNRQSRFHLFLGLSYPGPGDARDGLARRAIKREVAAEIIRASKTEPARCPPWKTKLGGEVGIHGHGSFADWTAGCVAVNNSEIEELWMAVPLGTPVQILP